MQNITKLCTRVRLGIYLKGIVYSACKKKCKAVFLKICLNSSPKVLMKQNRK